MSTLSYTIQNKGLIDYPGSSYKAKKLAEELLLKDAETHHCFFKAPSLHNHLSHHILAAYDLGAAPGLLQKVYDDEAKVQRPILLDDKDEEIVISQDNWKQHVGNINAYAGFYHFFTDRLKSSTVLDVLEEYVFCPEANTGGSHMLVRLISGALHPFIQVGYGLEFGDQTLVATGLAQTAVHPPLPPFLFSFENPRDPGPNEVNGNDGSRQPSRGPSVLEILRQVYESPILKPVMPYDPNALIYARLKAAMSEGRPQEIRRICSQLYIDEEKGDEELDAKVEECIWAATLLMFATGREGRKPRLDFFLMHLLTSSLFFRPFFKVLKNTTHKANLIRAFVPGIALVVLIRGRPIIKPELLMSYTDTPRPPSSSFSPDQTCLGNPLNDEDYSPWPALVMSSLHAPDSHLLKSMRALIFAAREYGDTPPGGAIGAFTVGGNAETHPGTSKLDGTIFIRAAGILMDYMGWVMYGQTARPDWDRSALGWDEAWDKEDG